MASPTRLFASVSGAKKGRGNDKSGKIVGAAVCVIATGGRGTKPASEGTMQILTTFLTSITFTRHYKFTMCACIRWPLHPWLVQRKGRLNLTTLVPIFFCGLIVWAANGYFSAFMLPPWFKGWGHLHHSLSGSGAPIDHGAHCSDRAPSVPAMEIHKEGASGPWTVRWHQ